MKLYIYKTRAVIITGSYTQQATFQPLQKMQKYNYFFGPGPEAGRCLRKNKNKIGALITLNCSRKQKNPERLNAFTTKLKKLIRDASF